METETLTTEEARWSGGWRMHPLLGFAISTVFVILVVSVSPVFLVFLMPRHPLAFEIAARGVPVVLIAIGYFLLVKYGERLPHGFDEAVALPLRRRPVRDFLIGCGIAVAMVSVCVVLIATVGEFNWRMAVTAAAARRTLVVLIMTLIAALLEELMFRGYPFQRLALGLSAISKSWVRVTSGATATAIGRVGAVLVFSALFGAIHLGNPGASRLGFINTIAIGVTLAVVYFWTDALWMAFGLHFGWNFVLGVIFGLPVSGLRIFETFAHGTAHGPRWLTGGSYGIEASATGTVVIVVATLLLLCRWRSAELKSSGKADELPVVGIQEK
jgi:uncharacterized protein